MSDAVRRHYERYPYPVFPLLASVRRCDTYALNLTALWCRFNDRLPPDAANRILIAGCGTFSPYPWSIANPDAQITALDLSERSLKRARLHCLLHGRRNIDFLCGDLLDEHIAPGPFGLIDAYGVLHHLDDPLSGLVALKNRLAPGGIIRIMLYSRYARREEEAVRFAMRQLGISDVMRAKQLLSKARPGSRLELFIRGADEIRNYAGLADALLHPCVHTYTIDNCLDLIRGAGLTPLLFSHHGATGDVAEDIKLLRLMERDRQSPGNLTIYLGTNTQCTPDLKQGYFLLNPCLAKSVGIFSVGSPAIAPRLGHANSPLSYKDRQLLRSFLRPKPVSNIHIDEIDKAKSLLNSLFLLHLTI